MKHMCRRLLAKTGFSQGTWINQSFFSLLGETNEEGNPKPTYYLWGLDSRTLSIYYKKFLELKLSLLKIVCRVGAFIYELKSDVKAIALVWSIGLVS